MHGAVQVIQNDLKNIVRVGIVPTTIATNHVFLSSMFLSTIVLLQCFHNLLVPVHAVSVNYVLLKSQQVSYLKIIDIAAW